MSDTGIDSYVDFSQNISFTGLETVKYSMAL